MSVAASVANDASAHERLTDVTLIWRREQIEHWLRFGVPFAERVLDRRRRILTFIPGAVFALVRWAGNGYGTAYSRIDILKAVPVGAAYTTVPGVDPGAERLLAFSGWPKVRLALELIDAVEALDIEPACAAPDYWRHVHNRILAGLPARRYSRSRHDAWLRRQRIDP